MAIIEANRFTSLKSRVKAECTRRAYAGSVAEYGGTSYDYTVNPATGKVILKEHYTKLAIPMNAINSTDTPNISDTRIVLDNDLTTMEAKLTIYESRDKEDRKNTDCSASCTGLCYGCTGCGGSCSHNCSGCSGCGDSCSYGCSSCSSGCANDCRSQCVDTCKGTCKNSCKNSCHSSCGTECSTSK